MSNQTSEAFTYIEREYKDAKGCVELQRRLVEQLHTHHLASKNIAPLSDRVKTRLAARRRRGA
jgi:hypothetical protein